MIMCALCTMHVRSQIEYSQRHFGTVRRTAVSYYSLLYSLLRPHTVAGPAIVSSMHVVRRFGFVKASEHFKKFETASLLLDYAGCAHNIAFLLVHKVCAEPKTFDILC